MRKQTELVPKLIRLCFIVLTIVEQIEFATDYLGADYIFWCTEEPYFSRDVVPYIKSLKQSV